MTTDTRPEVPHAHTRPSFLKHTRFIHQQWRIVLEHRQDSREV